MANPPDPPRIRAAHREAGGATPPSTSAIAPPAVTDRPRFAAIVGAMKCGTTTLFDHLAQHRQIAASSPKEPKYFSNDNWQNDLPSYCRLWQNYEPRLHKVLLEASTEYSKQPNFPDVAPRIARFAATHQIDFKFIYIVRDPARMIASGLHHGRQQQWGYGARDRLFEHLISVADFERQIASYRENFSDSRIHVVQLEKLIADEAAQIAAIFEFLGVDANELTRGAKMVAKNTEAMRNEIVSAKQTIERMPARTTLKGAWTMMPQGARKRLRPAVYHLLAAWGGSAPVVDDSRSWALREGEIDEIRRQLAPSLSRFAARYGIDRSLWSI